MIGEGTFGRVFRAFLKSDPHRKPYAMKVLKKSFLIKNKHLKYAVSEASIMQKTHHPFVVGMDYSF
jgi:protein kinase X